MKRILSGLVLCGVLSFVPVRAQDHDDHHDAHTRTYYDKVHKDSHRWDDHENEAWGHYRDEHHVKQANFARVNHKEQQNYWNWRHEHPDNH